MTKPLKTINLATNFQVKHAPISYSDKCYILRTCEAKIKLLVCGFLEAYGTWQHRGILPLVPSGCPLDLDRRTPPEPAPGRQT